MPVITARLALAATLASVIVLALPAGGPWLVLVNGVLLALAGLDYARTLDPRTLELRRHLPSRLRLDSAAELTWEVAAPPRGRPGRYGHGPLSPRRGAGVVLVDLADELAPSLRADTRRVRLRVPRGGRARATTSLRPGRRGRFTPTIVTLRTTGPLGLAARQRNVAVPGEALVLPAFPSRRDAELRIRRARLADAGERVARGRSARGEFDSLREYTIDDEFRRIDWLATARARAPVVRTYRAEQNQTVLVLLDTGRTMAARVEDVPRLDYAMDGALALSMVATRLGDRVGLVSFDREVRAVLPPRGRRGQLTLINDVLAGTDPRLVESDYSAAFATALARFRRRALLVVLTELAPGSIEQTLLPALPLVVRDHEVVVASVADPAVARWAVGAPAEASAAFRAAAAAAELSERRALRQRLQALGVQVVDERPADLGGRLADAYLRLKSSGAL